MSSPTRSKSRKPPSSPLPPKSPSGSYPVNKSRSPESHAEFIKTELHYILSHDDPQNIPIPPNSTRYIITTRFLTTWLNYTVYNSLLPPLNIDNTDLLHLQTLNKTKTLTVKPNLENNIHYRHVNEATWNTYARYYPDSGPAIRVPYKTVSDNKTWTIVETRLGIAKIKKKEKVIKRRGGGGGKHKGDGTLRATWLDKDDLVFNNDNHENINTALALSEALGKDAGGTDAGAADPALDHVLPRAWTSLYVQYLLGVTPSHPGPLDNVVLLVQQETLMGPTWSRCPTTLPPGEGEKLLFVQKQTFDQIVKSMKSSGPRIVRNTGGSAPSDGESAPTAASSPSRRASLAYRWNIDENFMLRKHMNMAVEAVPERSHAESAVVHFMNPMSSKKIGEIEARDKEMEREQKEQEAVAAAALFTGGLEQRRKSMAAEAAEEHKALIIEQTKLLMGGGTKLRSMSADGEAEEVSQEVLEERAADIICRFLLMKTIEHRKRLAKAKADRAYEEWAAMKFQSCWRTRKARRKVAAIKEEREKMKRDISALRVEAVWRTYQAKKAMRARKEDKEVDGAAKFISKVWRGRQAKKEFKGKLGAAGLLVRLARRQIDSRKTAEMRRELGKVPMRVKVVSASGVGGQESVWDGDVESRRSSFNPFHSPKSGTKSKGPNTRVYVSGFENTSMTATGLTKTSVKKGSGNPLYDETLIVGGDNFNGNGTLVLTVCEHSTLGTHKFLGQAVVNLKDVIETSFFKQGGAEGESVVLEGVGLGRYEREASEASVTRERNARAKRACEASETRVRGERA